MASAIIAATSSLEARREGLWPVAVVDAKSSVGKARARRATSDRRPGSEEPGFNRVDARWGSGGALGSRLCGLFGGIVEVTTKAC